jgi:putative ABC transport system ATP-binding protein
MSRSDTALIQAANVNHHFGEGEARSRILHDICLEIPRGQLVIMTGPSGSGKTTLLTLLGALRSVQEGSITVLGHDLQGLSNAALTAMRRKVGFIFQMHNLVESITAVRNVMMATTLQGVAKEDARLRSVQMLDRLGLGARTNYRPGALSGGQRQRVAVARALVNRPAIILADEPTAALDRQSSQEVVNLLQESASQDGASILMVTHDSRILDRADRIVSMVDGRIVSDVHVKEQVLIVQLLKKIGFFSSLDTAQLSSVAEKMRMRRFSAGDVLAREGDRGDVFYLVVAGEVDVRVTSNQGDMWVTTLEAGCYFGEHTLITGEAAKATMVGCSSGAVYVLAKEDFLSALRTVPSLMEQLQVSYFGRQDDHHPAGTP